MQEFKPDNKDKLSTLYFFDAILSGLLIYCFKSADFPARSPAISTPYDNYVFGFIILFPVITFIMLQIAILSIKFQKVEISVDWISYKRLFRKPVQFYKADIISAQIRRVSGRYGDGTLFLIIKTADQKLIIKGIGFSNETVLLIQQAIISGHANIEINDLN